MGFGFGVGDFIAVINLAGEIRSRFVDAPHQFRDLSNEVKSLSYILHDIEILPQPDLPGEEIAGFGEVIQSCKEVLKELEETLDKYQELDPTRRDFAGRSRRVWKRLRWDQKDIDRLRSRVTLNVSMLTTFLERISSQTLSAVKEGVNQLITHQRDQDRQAILNWLSPVDYALQQNDFIGRRQEGTGRWLLTSNEFRDWVSLSNQTLFCPGIPGAGKTISTAILIDELYKRFQNDSSIAIAYVYCNFRRQHEQKALDLLENLLKQLIWGLDVVPPSIQRLYEKHCLNRSRPSIDTISKTLQSIVPSYSRTFIVIDALDECQVRDREQAQFLTELLSLQTQAEINLFVTSRFIPGIEKRFRGSIRLEIRANDEDLSRYLHHHIQKLPSFVSRNSELQNNIKATIIKAVDGMFLLAQLHLDSLIGKRSPKAIRSALERLPKGSEAYDEAYCAAMKRIEGQISDSETLAKQVLSWITCAKRPLTTLELQHALAVEIDERELDTQNLPEIEDMVSVCAGLVTVDEQSSVIRLVHYTAQEFFIRTQRRWFENAETSIAEICMAYLSFDTFASGFCQSDEDFETRLKSNPLFDYAARNWGHHVRNSNDSHPNTEFLEDEAKVLASSQALMVMENHRYPGYSQRVPTQIRGMYLAAWFRLTEIVNWLVKKGHDINYKNSYGRTPLSNASANGSEEIVQLLLKKGAVVDSMDRDSQTPLLWASRNGHEAVVQMLLEKGAVVDSMDKYGQTPLLRASRNGHKAVVQILLKKGAVVDSMDKYDQTPLSWASGNGHEAVVQILLEKGAVVDSIGIDGWTPLSWASGNGHKAVVQLLLEKGAVVDSIGINGRTPLSWASENGHEAMVQILLEKGAVVDSIGIGDRTPLSWASENGHEAMVQILLEKGAVVDSTDKYSQTPLSWASGNGHKAVIQLLLEKGAVVDSIDIDGRTPLSWASENGHEAVVQLLLEKGAVVNSIDIDGRTPLSWASENGHEAVVQLLKKGAGAR
ncbi:hypothetical protein PV08_02733 [Exophiala spinifera]|uniref:Uncharacterized protein n=1 Tax=Exophiala spinifera TaxID=91928 RepID=A0A0D2BIP7_9EURO|nr:uncharacterized protein PV08_02733 [Exophiala spinifera]KIW18445.1 hypothetical protein PV08_02733 [Exophiala spinifera]